MPELNSIKVAMFTDWVVLLVFYQSDFKGFAYLADYVPLAIKERLNKPL